jgi:dihydrofolate reductase
MTVSPATISMIVALTRSGVIGRDNALPWRLSEDLKRFKRLTMGHHLIMGRRTYESIGRPLPGRTSIVLTRRPEELRRTLPEGVFAAATLKEAIALCGDDDEVFVIGGGEVFREALPLAHRAYVTWVEADVAGDTFFHDFPNPGWRLESETFIPSDPKNEYPTSFCVYECGEQVG